MEQEGGSPLRKRKFRWTIQELIESDPVLLAEVMEAADEVCPVMTADEAIAWLRAMTPGDAGGGKKPH